MTALLRLVGDEDAFDAWSEAACQAERDMVYDALFALADGSAQHRYDLHRADGGYRIAVGLTTTVHGQMDAHSFSVAGIERRPTAGHVI